MKILVSGNAGAGKSTLGRELAKRHGIRLYGLDRIVWKEGWEMRPKDKREKILQEIYKEDSWVLEGITKSGLKEADIIYFLDIPAYRCAFNVIMRFVKNGFGTRPDLPDNCPEYIGFFKALKTNFIFHKVTVPWLVNDDFHKEGAQFIHIKGYKELDKIINNTKIV